MAQRAWTANDQPTKPSAWVDALASASITRDASNVISSVAMQGAAGGSLTPPTTAMAPLYTATGFDGSSLPGIQFSTSAVKRLTGGTSVAGSQPFTLALVFKTGPSRAGYGIIFDTAASGNGNRAIFFERHLDTSSDNLVVYAGTVKAIPNTSVANTQYVVVVEFNGASSRVWINGSLITGVNAGAFGALVGLALGGSDSGTYFGGILSEAILYPAIFTGDDFDRLTQGTAWKWNMQAVIPAGSTYKNAAPMVDDGAATGTGTGSASGSGSAAGVGAAKTTATGVSAGSGAAAGVGASIVVGTGTAAGSSTATGAGAAIAASTGAAAGSSTASAPGSSIATGTGSAAGAGTAQGSTPGSTVITATGTASGASTVQGVGAATFRGTGSAAGAGLAAGAGQATASATGVAVGSGIAVGAGGAAIASTGTASGAAAVTGAGRATFVGTGSAMGSSTANGLTPLPAQTAPPLARNVVFTDTVARITALADKGTRAVSLN